MRCEICDYFEGHFTNNYLFKYQGNIRVRLRGDQYLCDECNISVREAAYVMDTEDLTIASVPLVLNYGTEPQQEHLLKDIHKRIEDLGFEPAWLTRLLAKRSETEPT